MFILPDSILTTSEKWTRAQEHSERSKQALEMGKQGHEHESADIEKKLALTGRSNGGTGDGESIRVEEQQWCSCGVAMLFRGVMQASHKDAAQEKRWLHVQWSQWGCWLYQIEIRVSLYEGGRVHLLGWAASTKYWRANLFIFSAYFGDMASIHIWDELATCQCRARCRTPTRNLLDVSVQHILLYLLLP